MSGQAHDKPFEFKKDASNEMLIGPDGAHYETEKKAFHYAFLGMCGCGNPEDAYNFCFAALQYFDRRPARAGGEWKDAEKELTKLISEKPDVAAHVFAHLLNERNLLEHGGGVGGSWLTAWGQQIVDSGPVSEDEFSDD